MDTHRTDNPGLSAAPRGAARRLALLAGWAAMGACVRPCAAQLAEDQVLVVYDSRVQDSREVAEFYAGSAKVPGGMGGQPGVHPRVRAVNLATIGGGLSCGSPPCIATPSINHLQFTTSFRDPLKNYLISQGVQRRVRCIVLTKGLPHRIIDTDSVGVGDSPAGAAAEFNAGDATYASVDSELSLMMIDLIAGEVGGTGDSKADGMIVNPYWRSTQPITASRTLNIQSAKSITNLVGVGQIWRAGTGTAAANIAPGDIYLVGRLDGTTLADVQNSIARAQGIVLDENAGAFILDEGAGAGLQNNSDTDNEFDNDGPTQINGGDDYEQTRDLLIADKRWLAANVRYDFAPGPSGFIVGPLINFGGGIVVSQPVAHLGTLGNNHNGGCPGTAGMDYAASFTYINGAVFNTLESFNGRALGGLTTLANQEQAADFLAAGGTLAIGNVNEPFSLSVADNLQIAQSFWLGNLTWIEAAYASLPVLSWQQTVLGDPLARVVRKREDITGDGVMNIDDLVAFYESASPPDLNRDGSVNKDDYALLERSVRAAEHANMNSTPNGKQQD